MKILITGAAGFVGTVVTRKLSAAGFKVFAHLGPPGVVATNLPSGIETLSADICDAGALAAFASEVDQVVHLAGPAAVADSFREPEEYLRSHVLGSAAIAKLLAQPKLRQVISLSSAEVYGRPESLPVGEEVAPEPRSPYAAAKIGAEQVLAAAARAESKQLLVLRPASIYGPGMRCSSVLGDILRQVFDPLSANISLRGPAVIRDYVHVEDVAAAVLLACQANSVVGVRVLNLGSGVGTRADQLAALITEMAGRALPVVTSRQKDRPFQADIPELILATSAIRQVLGWQPRLSLQEGLPSLLNWYAAKPRMSAANHP